jgi:hypothetical protein
MTAAEEKKIKELHTLLTNITEENKKHREDINLLVKVLNDKLDKKFLPVSLEENILQSAQQAIHKSIGDSLSGYNSPLSKLVSQVITEHESQLKSIVNSAFLEVINEADFRKSILQGFIHKVAKNIVNSGDGLMDKVTNDLKQSPQFRAQATLLISNLVMEMSKNE